MSAPETKHSPLPWIRSGVRYKLGSEDCIMIGPDGFMIAAFPIGRNPKDHASAFCDAGFTVEAVNSHSALQARVEELEEALKFYADAWCFTTHPKRSGLEWKPKESLLDDCGNIARAALQGGSNG
jgi:hypothetical protein